MKIADHMFLGQALRGALNRVRDVAKKCNATTVLFIVEIYFNCSYFAVLEAEQTEIGFIQHITPYTR